MMRPVCGGEAGGGAPAGDAGAATSQLVTPAATDTPCGSMHKVTFLSKDFSWQCSSREMNYWLLLRVNTCRTHQAGKRASMLVPPMPASQLYCRQCALQTLTRACL